ncbi:MAG: tRNA pseudouridine(13) synthase TruD [Patescibacteria group bacterium]|jgi:tRNA pseudouridine13 synthase
MQEKEELALKEIDEAKLSEIKRLDPASVVAPHSPQFTTPFLRYIGIDYDRKIAGLGMIKFLPSDFIVEEIGLDGQVSTINKEKDVLPDEVELSNRPITEAEVVKNGIGTLEAADRLANALRISLSEIGYAGLKDENAITSQKMTFNGVSKEQLRSVDLPNLTLKNIRLRKGVVGVGDLTGNRFTILVRTNPQLNEEILRERVTEVNKAGFLNFYSLQRFGSVRLNNHFVGQAIFKGNYDEAIRLILAEPSTQEIKVLADIRAKAAAFYGDWAKMTESFAQFPYFFRYDLELLRELQSTGKPVLALKQIFKSTKLFVHAYRSFWFNRLVSHYIKNNLQLPDELPVLNGSAEVLALYRPIIPESELSTLQFDQPFFGELFGNTPIMIKTRIMPKIYNAYKAPMGYVFYFDLDKGSYATTFLSEFFDLYQNEPVPEWVNQSFYDTRRPMNLDPLN